ncbi:Chaperone protein DnaK [Rubripirellula obstinata]|uniref:Chaperone protein DnaK n=1 Tax=Rubripirellula obstinata TaxID=406547 RepID=A0A5B1CN22_9BACT|nr:Hsp70 family protein [Rubripirellula obstinata]KAA1261956.1 Chaperone protein DnaK [Rubripirellula obstinata]
MVTQPNNSKNTVTITDPIVGIDLGTTRSAVAYVDFKGDVKTLPNSEGDLITPSAVLFEDGGVTVGKEAIKALTVTPQLVALHAKREMGNPTYSKTINGQTYPPEMIQSFVLGKLRRDAGVKLGCEVTKAVVTVPAYFNEPKRRATLDAGKFAGLDVRAVINEPTAAAIAFGVDRVSRIVGKQTVLVYDLGGGTFDVSVVEVEGKKIRVLATDGNSRLGGIDWDKCLARWIDAQFSVKHSIKPSQSELGIEFLRKEAEELKQSLSARKKAKVRLSFQGKTIDTEITREAFDEMTAHLLDRTRFTVNKVIKESKLEWIELDRILLVGGSTRMPMVPEMLKRESGIDPDASVSADEVVAHGAAIYASTLLESTDTEDGLDFPSITDVNAHNLSVLATEQKTGRRVGHVMIARNTTLPASQITRFHTIRDNQPSVVVEVVEGGNTTGLGGTKIGRCVIDHLPPHLAAGTPVDVAFRYDLDGLIHIEAILPTTGQRTEMTIDRAAGLSGDDRDKMQDVFDALGLND